MKLGKRKRYQPSVSEIYEQAGLTPILVVIGGSQSYGHDNPQDTDYYGYHDENTPEDIIIGGEYWRGPYWNTTEPELIPRIRTFSISTVTARLRGDMADEDAMYCMDNWIFHTAVLETDESKSFRAAWVIPFFTKVFAQYYARSAKGFYTSSMNVREGKLWERAIRTALTAKHLDATGELECNVRLLKDKYGTNQSEHVVQLMTEITGLVS